jgi:hypothetical protein
MRNFKVIFISMVVGALVYHFGKGFIKKMFEKKVDNILDQNLNSSNDLSNEDLSINTLNNNNNNDLA